MKGLYAATGAWSQRDIKHHGPTHEHERQSRWDAGCGSGTDRELGPHPQTLSAPPCNTRHVGLVRACTGQIGRELWDPPGSTVCTSQNISFRSEPPSAHLPEREDGGHEVHLAADIHQDGDAIKLQAVSTPQRFAWGSFALFFFALFCALGWERVGVTVWAGGWSGLASRCSKPGSRGRGSGRDDRHQRGMAAETEAVHNDYG